MAAEWVDVTGPAYWESAEKTGFGTLVPPDPDPLVWDGTRWVWESYYGMKGFVWVNSAEVFASAIRLTYTMTNVNDPPIAEVWLNDGDEYSEHTFAWFSAPQPDSGVSLPISDADSIFGFGFRVVYEVGYLTKIELFMEPLAPPPSAPQWLPTFFVV